MNSVQLIKELEKEIGTLILYSKKDATFRFSHDKRKFGSLSLTC